MDFLSKLLQGISFVPALVTGIEKLLWWTIRRGQERRRTVLCADRALHERRNH